jgi:cobalt transporter subunit CbtB
MLAAPATRSLSAAAGGRLWAAVIAGLMGLLVLYGAGFANSATIHNAAHDARHAFGFPCH